jgi:hypothetical protein
MFAGIFLLPSQGVALYTPWYKLIRTGYLSKRTRLAFLVLRDIHEVCLHSQHCFPKMDTDRGLGSTKGFLQDASSR